MLQAAGIDGRVYRNGCIKGSSANNDLYGSLTLRITSHNIRMCVLCVEHVEHPLVGLRHMDVRHVPHMSGHFPISRLVIPFDPINNLHNKRFGAFS